eukprot:CAMPEP_0194490758 /NCGR_PEP_ID=MMETSP0253-20130528/9860_1 /TAXON_ID=2966 /ORGANISM="Noctiluca scintillans" /LENGTH=235 /DNA_ID=CAMNT_0039331419 /DNA_START=31 /DNA_END=735 /DNA_ORIENTATION=+
MDEVALVDNSLTSPECDTNAVSHLHEIVQRFAAVSPHVKVLSWSYEQLLKNDQLQFRATVSFTLDVPHHFFGGWQTSKKKAQRHTAERVQHYLMSSSEVHDAMLRSLPAVLGDLDHNSCTQWELETRSAGLEDGFRATVAFHLHGVPHHFCGSWSSSADAARRDTTDRVLWYFGKNQGAFEAPKMPKDVAIPAHIKDQATNSEPQETEDKTILMQVQNILQRMFAKSTPCGQPVW